MQPARKRAKRHRRPWSELPHDLLSVILDRPTTAYGDRVHFRGVCQAWRAAELAHPRPTMPWLVAPGHCISLHDASIHRVPLPQDAAASVCLGSFGHWLALLPPTPDRPFLLNAFTMERIRLPRRRTEEPMVKLVLSSAPDSESCTVAAIVGNTHQISDYYVCSKIVVCRVRAGRRRGSWRALTGMFDLHDIIFFEGKLHALDGKGRVHVYQDGDLRRRGEPCWPPFKHDLIQPSFYLGNAKLHLVVLHGRLHMVGRALGTNRVPGSGCMHFTCALGVFTVVGKWEKWPEPVKDLGGHAIFIGDSCCNAFPVSLGDGKIRENQICFVDDEKNYVSSLAARRSELFRLLQSFDVRSGCLRTYRPQKSSPGTWRCVTAQRFPHKRAMGPLLGEAVSEEELRLRDMASSLGASAQPHYRTHGEPDPDTGESRVTVGITVPKTASVLVLPKEHRWSFTQSRPSAREARQAAAHDATTFLRSRFRNVFDDSPWSSIPHYHSHVDEDDDDDDDEEEEEEEVRSGYHWLFWNRRWYGAGLG